MSIPPRGPVAAPPPSQDDVAPSLREEAAGDVLSATPDFAAASTLFEQDSARRRAFNTYSMHALARDPKAMRVLQRACGLWLETPASQIIANGWSYLTPEVQRHVVEVLAPAWLARAAPDLSDPGIWTATPRP